MDLIFHLGLTKTGSSFLQQKVFRGKFHTLDRSIGFDADAAYARRFQDFFLKSAPSAWNSAGGKAWFKRLSDSADTHALISHESLYEHIPFTVPNDRLRYAAKTLADRLVSIKDHCWPHGDVKVFFFYRHQPDWLASIYSHVAYALPFPSQQHFETSVSDFLTKKDISAVVDYAQLHDTLSQALGRQNVLAVPYDAFSKRQSWDKIIDFSGLQLSYADIPFFDKSINTKRKDEAGTWKPATRITRLGKNNLVRSLERFLPTQTRQNLRSTIKKTFSNSWELNMPEGLRQQIANHYADSNRQISSISDENLTSRDCTPERRL